MNRWQQALDEACKAMMSLSVREGGDWKGIHPGDAIAAIRTIPEPPEPSEEDLILEVCHRSYAGEIDLHDPRHVAGLIVPIIRAHDKREADGVRDVLRDLLVVARDMDRLIGKAAPDNDLYSKPGGISDRYEAVSARAEKAVKS